MYKLNFCAFTETNTSKVIVSYLFSFSSSLLVFSGISHSSPFVALFASFSRLGSKFEPNIFGKYCSSRSRSNFKRYGGERGGVQVCSSLSFGQHSRSIGMYCSRLFKGGCCFQFPSPLQNSS